MSVQTVLKGIVRAKIAPGYEGLVSTIFIPEGVVAIRSQRTTRRIVVKEKEQEDSELPYPFERYSFQIDRGVWLIPPHDRREEWTPDWFLNNSCDPNLGMYSNFDMITRRPIYPGEQVTIDYAMFEEDNCIVRCGCKVDRCIGCNGPSGGFRSLLENHPDIVEEYLRGGHISPYLVSAYGL